MAVTGRFGDRSVTTGREDEVYGSSRQEVPSVVDHKGPEAGVWCRMSGGGLGRTGGGQRGLVEWPKLEAQTRQSVSVYAGPGRELEN